MRHDDHTGTGGVCGRFLSTEWSIIEDIKRGGDPGDTLVGRLLEQYWKPVYCYLRRKGMDNEAAKDLTQGFFQEVVLGRNLIQKADQTRGSFRRLLLTALERYLQSEYRKRVARKRYSGSKRIPFEQIDLVDRDGPTTHLTAEESFNYAWLACLLDEVLADVEAECQAHNLERHWTVFCERVVTPILNEVEPPPLAEIAQKHAIAEPARISNMIVTVNRRLQTAMRRHLRQYVSTDAEAEEELAELLRIFNQGSAR